MTDILNIHPKIIATINSCVTLDQINNCFGLADLPHSKDTVKQIRIKFAILRKIYQKNHEIKKQKINELRK